MKYWLVVGGGHQNVPLLAIGVPKQKEKKLPAELAEYDAPSGGALIRVFASGDFTGAKDQVWRAYLNGAGPQRLILVGLGKPDEVGRTQVRRAAAIAARRARSSGAGDVAFAMPAAFRGKVGPKDFAQAAAEGLGQGAWQFDELKTANKDEKKPPVASVAVWAGAAEKAEAEAGFALGQAIAEGQSLARRLQFLPPNQCTPAFLGETAVEIGKRLGLTVTVLDKAAIEKEGMGALLAVAQGSATEPRFITLEYKGAGDADAKPVVLIGKGITFDTGGISIKPASSM
jgi:leucyl aminopeptidase